MAVEFYIHKMSEHMETGEIIQWMAAEGDHVAEHQPIIEVMTDKFAVELEAPATGVLAGIRPGCVPGATVPVGEPIAYIVRPGEAAPQLPPLPGFQPNLEVAEAAHTPAAISTNQEPNARVRSTPVARRMAKDLGVDIELVMGTGIGGRVTEADIRAAVVSRKVVSPVAPPIPSQALPAPADLAQAELPLPGIPQPAVTEREQWLELTQFQRITGERMRESIVNAPQFALQVTADVTNLLWVRTALQDRVTLEARARLSLTGLLVKIVAAVLARHPRANASFENGRLRLNGAINVGVAIGSEQGLVVPVIKQADEKTLAQVTGELSNFQAKAGRMHFRPEDLSEGTFTLSNLGMFGVERFAAIVNPPQSAILAVGAVVKAPIVLHDGRIEARSQMALSVTIDHRVMDGLQGARFLGEIREKIETPYFLI